MRFSAYEDYQDTDFDWMGSIPSSWAIKRVGHHVEFISGFAFKSEFFSFDKGIKIVRGDNVTEGMLRWGDKTRYWPEVTKDLEQYLLKNNDILIGMDGSKVGKNYTVVRESDLPLLLVQRVARLRTDENLDYRFLSYLIGSELFRIWVALVKTDPAIPHISPADIRGFPLPYPSSVEQEKIANFLDHETAKIDTLIEKQQQLIKLLKEKRQAVISHAVTKGISSLEGAQCPMRDSGVEWLGEVPEHWDVAKVKYFASIQGGYAFSSDSFQESGVQLLRIGNVYLNRLALERQPTFVDESFVKSHRDFSVRRGDILMSLTGTLGKTDYGFAVHVDEDGPFMLNQRVAKITPVESKIAPEYLIYAIRSESYLKQLYSLPSGTKQANLSNDDVINIPIVVPPTMEEQLLVAQYISDNLHKYNKLIKKSEAAIEIIQERRTALISAAVTGKIDVRSWVAPEPSGNQKRK